jgi:hypothetical protein
VSITNTPRRAPITKRRRGRAILLLRHLLFEVPLLAYAAGCVPSTQRDVIRELSVSARSVARSGGGCIPCLYRRKARLEKDERRMLCCYTRHLLYHIFLRPLHLKSVN